MFFVFKAVARFNAKDSTDDWYEAFSAVQLQTPSPSEPAIWQFTKVTISPLHAGTHLSAHSLIFAHPVEHSGSFSYCRHCPRQSSFSFLLDQMQLRNACV